MAQRKIDIFGQFRPTAADTSQADVFRSLAGLAGQATGLAIEKGLERRQEQGRLEGLQAGQQAAETGGKPEKRDAVFSVADKAYNEAALLSYRAGIRRDTKETLNRLQNEHELDPDAFRQTAAKYKQGILQGMPEEFQFVINDDIENEIASRGMQLDDRLYKFEKDQNIALVQEEAEDLKDDILNRIRQGDVAGAANLREQRKLIMDRAVANGYVSPQQAKADAEQMLEAITIHGEIGKLEGIFADPDLSMEEKIVKATMIVDSKKNAVYKDLDPQQRDALNSALQGKLNEQLKLEAEMYAQSQKELANETIELKLDAQHGRRPPEEIMAKAYEMQQNQQITEPERLAIENQVLKQQQKDIQKALSLSKVAERLAGDESLVVSQQENDLYWDSFYAPVWKDLGPQQRVALAAEYSKNVGGIPTALKKQITNNIRSMDQDLIIEASQTIDAIDNVRGLEPPVTAHDRAFVQLVTDLSQSMEPEEALKYAREQSDPANKARIESRERIIDSEKYRDEYEENAVKIFKGTFDVGDVRGIDSLNSGQMGKEYGDLFETYFKAGMDEDAARAKAEQIIAKNWTYSESSGRYMKYSPEQYYAVQGDSSYIQEQLDEFVRSNTSFGLSLEGYQRAFLVSDQETGQLAAQQRPDYLVYVQDKNGELHPIGGVDPSDGKPGLIRWSPDPKAQQEKLKSMSEQQIKEMREAAQKRRNLLDKPAQHFPLIGF